MRDNHLVPPARVATPNPSFADPLPARRQPASPARRFPAALGGGVARATILGFAVLLAAAAAPAAPAPSAATAATERFASPPPLPPPPTAEEAAQLATGGVVLSSRPVGGPGTLSEEIGRGLIDAAPERVFAALVDFAHYQEWVPFVKHSDAHPRTDGSVISFQSLDLPFPLGNRHYKVHARIAVEGQGEAQVWRTWWTYIPGSGNVADHHGWWILVPYTSGGARRTLATGLLFTDPGGSTPAWALHRGMAQTVPYVFSGLRQQIHRSRYDRP